MNYTRIYLEPKGVFNYFDPDNSEHEAWLKSAVSIRFYLRGINDIVLIKAPQKWSVDVFIPANASISSGTGTQYTSFAPVLESQLGDIEKEISSNVIKPGEWFAWDTKKKIALTRDSFVEFIPHYRMSEQLFIFETVSDEGTVILSPLFGINGKSSWKDLSFLMLLMSKLELYKVESPTDTGKALLAFLLKEFYSLPVPFNSPDSGPWRKVLLSYPENAPPEEPSLFLPQEMTSKLREISSRIVYEDVGDGAYETLDAEWERLEEGAEDDDMSSIVALPTLSDLVTKGKEFILSKAPGGGLVRLVIDVMQNEYRAVAYDPLTDTFLVELHYGANKIGSDVTEELGLSASDVVFGVMAD